MNLKYRHFLKSVRLTITKINWNNKKLIKSFRPIWSELSNQPKYSPTPYFLKKHNVLLRLGMRTIDKSYRLTSINFWVLRGWSLAYATNKVSTLQQKNSKHAFNKYMCSPSSVKYVMCDKMISESEAKKITTKRDRKTFADWDKEELSNLSNNAILKWNAMRLSIKIENPIKYKTLFNTTIEYYIAKGHDINSAQYMLSKRQNTFSLDGCIGKHGVEKGTTIFNDRQIKWQQTMTNKPQEEIDIINSKKAQNLLNFKRKYGEIIGKEKYDKFLRYRKNYTSKEAVQFFTSLDEALPHDCKTQWTNLKDMKEYWIYDKILFRPFFFDYTIHEYKLIIEYNGVAFHPNPLMSNQEWRNWKFPYSNENADDISKKDKYKLDLARSKGFTIIEVWSNDNLPESIEKIVKYIETHKGL